MEELLQWVFLSGTDTAVTQTEDGADRGRPAGDRGEVPRALRGDGPALLLRPSSSRTRRASSALSASRARSRSSSTRTRGTCSRSWSTRPRSPSATRSSISRFRWPDSGSRCSRNAASSPHIPTQAPPRLGRRGSASPPSCSSSCPGRCGSRGPARVLPGRRAAVTVAGRRGRRRRAHSREGDRVEGRRRHRHAQRRALSRPPWRRRAPAHASPRATIARARAGGRRRRRLRRRSRGAARPRRASPCEEDRLVRTRLTAPAAGVIVTPRIEERVGQFLARGAELCVVADVRTVTAEVAVPESDAGLVKAGQKTDAEVQPFPAALFRGEVDARRARASGRRATSAS